MLRKNFDFGQNFLKISILVIIFEKKIDFFYKISKNFDFCQIFEVI